MGVIEKVNGPTSVNDEKFTKYQVMPDLSDEKYEILKADIKERGVQLPVEFDTEGYVLEGHHRIRACWELGIDEYPFVVRVGMTEKQKFTHARKQNIVRRQLSREQLNSMIDDELMQDSTRSDRQIAKELGVEDKDVASRRRFLEALGKIAKSEYRVGADGKTYAVGSARNTKQQQIQAELEAHPEKSDRQIGRELGVSHHTVNAQRERWAGAEISHLPTLAEEPTDEPVTSTSSDVSSEPTYHVTVPYEPEPIEHEKPKLIAKPVSVFNPSESETKAIRDPEVVSRMAETGETADKAQKAIKREKKAEEVKKAQSLIASEQGEGSAKLIVGDSIGKTVDCDLLLTDPPYSTDVDDIDEFVDSWLFSALDGVKPTGFAYVFIGAYPEELRAYLNAEIPAYLELCQILVWEYKNTLGQNPKGRYKQNWQACLFYRGVDAPDLNCPLTNEQWAVQEVNAPDGRLGDRYHAWQKPLDLVTRFIRHSTTKGMTVYDPFACTGTTLVAAAKLGRHAIGYEIDEKNADIAFGRGVVRGT